MFKQAGQHQPSKGRKVFRAFLFLGVAIVTALHGRRLGVVVEVVLYGETWFCNVRKHFETAVNVWVVERVSGVQAAPKSVLCGLAGVLFGCSGVGVVFSYVAMWAVFFSCFSRVGV